MLKFSFSGLTLMGRQPIRTITDREIRKKTTVVENVISDNLDFLRF